MTPGASDVSRGELLYRFALRLYPARFREAYAPAMHQAFRDALAGPLTAAT